MAVAADTITIPTTAVAVVVVVVAVVVQAVRGVDAGTADEAVGSAAADVDGALPIITTMEPGVETIIVLVVLVDRHQMRDIGNITTIKTIRNSIIRNSNKPLHYRSNNSRKKEKPVLLLRKPRNRRCTASSAIGFFLE